MKRATAARKPWQAALLLGALSLGGPAEERRAEQASGQRRHGHTHASHLPIPQCSGPE